MSSRNSIKVVSKSPFTLWFGQILTASGSRKSSQSFFFPNSLTLAQCLRLRPAGNQDYLLHQNKQTFPVLNKKQKTKREEIHNTAATFVFTVD